MALTSSRTPAAWQPGRPDDSRSRSRRTAEPSPETVTELGLWLANWRAPSGVRTALEGAGITTKQLSRMTYGEWLTLCGSLKLSETDSAAVWTRIPTLTVREHDTFEMETIRGSAVGSEERKSDSSERSDDSDDSDKDSDDEYYDDSLYALTLGMDEGEELVWFGEEYHLSRSTMEKILSPDQNSQMVLKLELLELMNTTDLIDFANEKGMNTFERESFVRAVKRQQRKVQLRRHTYTEEDPEENGFYTDPFVPDQSEEEAKLAQTAFEALTDSVHVWKRAFEDKTLEALNDATVMDDDGCADDIKDMSKVTMADLLSRIKAAREIETRAAEQRAQTSIELWSYQAKRCEAYDSSDSGMDSDEGVDGENDFLFSVSTAARIVPQLWFGTKESDKQKAQQLMDERFGADRMSWRKRRFAREKLKRRVERIELRKMKPPINIPLVLPTAKPSIRFEVEEPVKSKNEESDAEYASDVESLRVIIGDESEAKTEETSETVTQSAAAKATEEQTEVEVEQKKVPPKVEVSQKDETKTDTSIGAVVEEADATGSSKKPLEAEVSVSDATTAKKKTPTEDESSSVEDAKKKKQDAADAKKKKKKTTAAKKKKKKTTTPSVTSSDESESEEKKSGAESDSSEELTEEERKRRERGKKALAEAAKKLKAAKKMAKASLIIAKKDVYTGDMYRRTDKFAKCVLHLTASDSVLESGRLKAIVMQPEIAQPKMMTVGFDVKLPFVAIGICKMNTKMMTHKMVFGDVGDDPSKIGFRKVARYFRNHSVWNGEMYKSKSDYTREHDSYKAAVPELDERLSALEETRVAEDKWLPIGKRWVDAVLTKNAGMEMPQSTDSDEFNWQMWQPIRINATVNMSEDKKLRFFKVSCAGCPMRQMPIPSSWKSVVLFLFPDDPKGYAAPISVALG